MSEVFSAGVDVEEVTMQTAVDGGWVVTMVWGTPDSYLWEGKARRLRERKAE